MNSLVGKVLKNRYRIDAMIGRGGMAEVYKVWDQERAVYLAMKLLHQDMAIDRVFVRRFQREANTLQKLNHPNIVRFYDFVQEDSLAMMLLEFISGWTLKQFLFQAKGPMTYAQVATILRSVCVALQYAHSQGFVHSDIKPANIMIDDQGNVMLADFGIARMTDAATATMVGAGTPAYMAPEQIRGEDPRPQTDVYALGVVLFELLTGGERPFTGEHSKSTGTMSEKVRWEQMFLDPPSPKKWNQAIHDEVVDVIMCCLEKDPEKRYKNPLELLSAFDQAVLQSGVSGEATPGLEEIIQNLKSSPPLQTGSREFSEAIVSDAKVIIKPPFWKSLTFQVGAIVIIIGLIAGMFFFKPFKGGGQVSGNPAGDSTYQADLEANTDPTEESQSETIPEPTQTSTETPEIPATVTVEPTNSIFVTSTPVNILAGSIEQNPKDQAPIVFIPSSEFTMGLTDAQVQLLQSTTEDCIGSIEASTPTHPVYLDAYWIYQTEVTNGMYQQCVQAGACDPPNKLNSETRRNYYGNSQFGHYPVVMVSWLDADAYCNWAGGRLPTSAEWEYAARGDDGRLYPWGNQTPTVFLANFDLKVGDTEPVTDWPEGISPFGLYHMAGNVFEWVGDWYSTRYYQISPYANPSGPTNESGELSKRVLRGGSWGWDAGCASSGVQDHWEEFESGTGVGFRCVIPYQP